MDGVSLPYLPLGLWLLSGAVTILLLLVMFGFYAYSRKRMNVTIEGVQHVADLAAKKQILQADIESRRQWMETQKAELERLTAEREEQERLRGLLADLERQCSAKENEHQNLRKEVGEFENQKYLITETNERIKAEVSKLESEKQASEKQFETFLAEVNVKTLEIENEKQIIEKTLSEKRSDLVAATEALNEMRAKGEAVTQRIGESEARLVALSAENQNLEKKQETIQAEIEKDETLGNQTLERIKAEVSKLESEKQAAEKQFETFLTEVNVKKLEIEKTLSGKRSELVVATEALNEMRAKVEAVAQRIGESEARLVALSAENQNLEKKQETIQAEIEKAETLEKQALEKANEANTSSEAARKLSDDDEQRLREIHREAAGVEAKLSALSHEKLALERQTLKMKEELTQTESVDPKEALGLSSFDDLLRVSPPCLSAAEFSDGSYEKLDELDALKNLRVCLRDQGLNFSERVVFAFHTSLKCQSINPLTVLAGVSGTGKTLLPLKYAKYMGMHSLVMAVQPRWDSPQDLFGFYNYLEKRYKATDLSRAMIRMDDYNFPVERYPILDGSQASDRMLLVLLDEMNLARTEYYFSEFLSKLEIRRLIDEPKNRIERERAEFVLDAGPASAGRFRIWVGDNMLFVGTMNEDETTQTLSDKVLDRSNILRFGKPADGVWPRPENGNGNGYRPTRYVPRILWKTWVKPFDSAAPWCREIQGWTTRLNSALSQIGRPFGYRVQEAIGTYVVNYPDVGSGNHYKRAFADQVEQKIIPKLRGLDLNEDAAMMALDEVAGVIEGLDDPELQTTFEKSRKDSSAGMFLWAGVTRLPEND